MKCEIISSEVPPKESIHKSSDKREIEEKKCKLILWKNKRVEEFPDFKL